jgi:predicted acetyltransferase
VSIDVRTVRESEFEAWGDAVDVGFYHPENRGNQAYWRRLMPGEVDAGRVIGAFDGAATCGTFRNVAQEVTVPGGASLRVGAVTAVTVLQTHRRRGVLSRMMELGLRQSDEAGEALSILIPAEYAIYGRFGFGRATEQATWRVDAVTAAAVRPLPGTVEFMPSRQWCREMPAVHDRVRAANPGAILRPTGWWWEREAGLITRSGSPDDLKTLFAVVRDGDGVPRGYAKYRIDEKPWTNFRPAATLHASILAETPEFHVRLLQFLWEQDWVTEIEIGTGSVNDTWRHLLANPRLVAQTDRIDVLWARVLDVPKALSARTYSAGGRIVLGIEDKDCYAAGTFALEAGPDGVATCQATTESPDLTMPVQSLGSLYFGGVAASALASIGRIAEERSGALALADRMFVTPAPPYCVTWF